MHGVMMHSTHIQWRDVRGRVEHVLRSILALTSTSQSAGYLKPEGLKVLLFAQSRKLCCLAPRNDTVTHVFIGVGKASGQAASEGEGLRLEDTSEPFFKSIFLIPHSSHARSSEGYLRRLRLVLTLAATSTSIKGSSCLCSRTEEL